MSLTCHEVKFQVIQEQENQGLYQLIPGDIFTGKFMTQTSVPCALLMSN